MVSRYLGPTAAALADARASLVVAVDGSRLPGAVALVAFGEEILQLDAVGRRDIEAGLPMEPDTIFRIASMTKPIVSVGALMLVESGSLDLEDQMARYIPAFADSTVFEGMDGGVVRSARLQRPITIRHLLTHTSGLEGEQPHPDLAESYRDLEATDGGMPEVMRRLAGLPLAHQPGDGWRYGWSHEVLGHIIEIVADRPLDDYLATTIFMPLGMADSGFYAPSDKQGRLAVPYERVDGTFRVVTGPDAQGALSPPAIHWGGGGCVSTVLDFHRFLRMLQRGGELDGVRLLAAATVAEMTRNQLDASLIPIQIDGHVFPGEGYGLGVGVIVGPGGTEPVGSVGSYTWSGGWNSTFCVDPVKGLSGIVLAQYDPWTWYREGAEYWSIVWRSVAAV